jgi:hypothetical protein
MFAAPSALSSAAVFFRAKSFAKMLLGWVVWSQLPAIDVARDVGIIDRKDWV